MKTLMICSTIIIISLIIALSTKSIISIASTPTDPFAQQLKEAFGSQIQIYLIDHKNNQIQNSYSDTSIQNKDSLKKLIK